MARGTRAITSFAFLLLASTLLARIPSAAAQPIDDRLTFQGELRDGSELASGPYSFRFRLYDAPLAGTQIGPELTHNATLIDGRFTAPLHFPGAFDAGQQRYIDVEASALGSGVWTPLGPRLLITAAPLAAWALSAATATTALNTSSLGGQLPTFYTNAANMTAGALPSPRLSGEYASVLNLTNTSNIYWGSGANLTGLNATNLDAGTISDLRLSSNVSLLNASQTFTAPKSFDLSAPAALTLTNSSPDGLSLVAVHSAITGATPAILARTNSATEAAFAIHALVSSTTPGNTSSALRGENQGASSQGFGVWGSHAGTGSGVYGSSQGGIGVYGHSTGSYGGYFDTDVPQGVALWVQGAASVGVLTIRGGADLAEAFEVSQSTEDIRPGMLVMIDPDHPGKVKLARGAYNSLVAGVVSGANKLEPGMILGQFEGQTNSRPIALAGRVWAFAETAERPIEPGDLLTTSDIPGHAMRAGDPKRAHGATIGKAMSRLPQGEKGMVLVLVNLQ